MTAALWRKLQTAAAAAGWLTVAGCQSSAVEGKIAAGDDGLSFFGPGSERLVFGKLPAIRFDPTSWRVAEAEGERLGEAAAVVAGGRRVLLVGVGDDGVPMEHGRQQALARALSVRGELARRGVEAPLVLVTGVSAEESVGLATGSPPGPRVECVVIRPAHGTERIQAPAYE